jgi:hypothetical protein
MSCGSYYYGYGMQSSCHVILGRPFFRIIGAMIDMKDGNQKLREFHRCGGKYTWRNKHLKPTMDVLERVLVFVSWEALFPLAVMNFLVRSRSDHS